MIWRAESATIVLAKFTGFTAHYRWRKLIHYEHCTDVQDAIAREKQLKISSRAKKVAFTATLNPRWKELAPEILGE